MAFIVILGFGLFVFSSMSIKIVFVLIFVQCAIKTKGKIIIWKILKPWDENTQNNWVREQGAIKGLEIRARLSGDRKL